MSKLHLYHSLITVYYRKEILIKLRKAIIPFMLCLILLSNTTYSYATTPGITLNAVAANDNITIENEYEGPSLQSTKVPSTYIDLSYGTVLAFNVEKLTYGNLYTNYGFTNVTAIQVDVNPISVDKNGSNDTVEDLTITLHKKGSSADLASIKVSTSGGTVYFYNLNSSTKYYLEFSKRNDGQIFKFDGTISDASDLFD